MTKPRHRRRLRFQPNKSPWLSNLPQVGLEFRFVEIFKVYMRRKLMKLYKLIITNPRVRCLALWNKLKISQDRNFFTKLPMWTLWETSSSICRASPPSFEGTMYSPLGSTSEWRSMFGSPTEDGKSHKLVDAYCVRFAAFLKWSKEIWSHLPARFVTF